MIRAIGEYTAGRQPVPVRGVGVIRRWLIGGVVFQMETTIMRRDYAQGFQLIIQRDQQRGWWLFEEERLKWMFIVDCFGIIYAFKSSSIYL